MPRAPSHATADRPPSERVGISRADLHAVVTVDPDSSCLEALALLQRHRITALPVTTPSGQLLGIVTLLDLLLPPDHTLTAPADRSTKVQMVMTTNVITAHPDDLIEQLVPHFSDGGLHHMPVLDGSERVIGMVTQADLIAALFHAHIER